MSTSSTSSIPHFSLVIYKAPLHLQPSQKSSSDETTKKDELIQIFLRARDEYDSFLPATREELKDNPFWLSISATIILQNECVKIIHFLREVTQFLAVKVNQLDQVVNENYSYTNENQRNHHVTYVKNPALAKKNLYFSLGEAFYAMRLDFNKVDAMIRSNPSQEMDIFYEKLEKLLVQIEYDDFVAFMHCLSTVDQEQIKFRKLESFIEKVLVQCKIKFHSQPVESHEEPIRKFDYEEAYKKYCSILLKENKFEQVISIINNNFSDKESSDVREKISKRVVIALLEGWQLPMLYKFINDANTKEERFSLMKFLFGKVALNPDSISKITKNLEKICKISTEEKRVKKIQEAFEDFPKKIFSPKESSKTELKSESSESKASEEKSESSSFLPKTNYFLTAYNSQKNDSTPAMNFLVCASSWLDSLNMITTVRLNKNKLETTDLLAREKNQKQLELEMGIIKNNKEFCTQMLCDFNEKKFVYGLVSHLKLLNPEWLVDLEEGIKSCLNAQFFNYKTVLDKANLLNQIRNKRVEINELSRENPLFTDCANTLNDLHLMYCKSLLDNQFIFSDGPADYYHEADLEDFGIEESMFSYEEKTGVMLFSFLKDNKVDWLVKYFMHKNLVHGLEKTSLINHLVVKYLDKDLIHEALRVVNEFVDDSTERNNKILNIFQNRLLPLRYKNNILAIETVLQSIYPMLRGIAIVELYDQLLSSGVVHAPEKKKSVRDRLKSAIIKKGKPFTKI